MFEKTVVYFLRFQLKKNNVMKATKKIIAGLGIITVIGLTIYIVRRSKTNRMHRKISDHGYETAHDILYPQKHKQKRKYKYGPVIPS